MKKFFMVLIVTPAKAGVQNELKRLDSLLPGECRCRTEKEFFRNLLDGRGESFRKTLVKSR